MPFTGSHPVAILPFLRTPLPASALVIGSVTPDIPLYLPVELGVRTHTALAVVTTDVVLGLLAWALWHGVLAAPALATAPAGLRARLRAMPGLRQRLSDARRVALVLAALSVGAGTHVLWDEFTHARRWGAEHVPALAETWWLLPGYRWAQYLSSVVGIALLLAWLVRWWRRTPARTVRDRAGAWPWLAVAGAGLAAGGLAAGVAVLDGRGPGDVLLAASTWGGGVALGVAVVLALTWHGRRVRADRS